MRIGDLEVAAPYPGAALPVMDNHREWLGIMNHDHVVMNMHPDRVFMDHFLEHFNFLPGEMVIPPLKRIMHFLSGGEEVGRAGDDPPSCLYAQAVHQKGKRGEYFRHSPAVKSGIDVRNV